ncbi:MAG: DUF3782 domain-containing protein [Thermodesulfatator sp.]|nr:MAG: DUF3782 domain-containing protein [Thermodesulfatator sp.]
MWAYLQEVGKRLDQIGEEIKELRESLREQGRETDRRLREESERTEEKIRELANLFTTQWGKLVEALVEPGAVNLFRERGIKVRRSARRIEVEDEQGRKIAEYDIFLENDEEVVIIEVKTTVKKEDVDEFLEKLREFKDLNPKYRDYRVYGAVAGITFEEGVDKYAYRRGLFVLKSEGGIIRIANDPDFKPRIW